MESSTTTTTSSSSLKPLTFEDDLWDQLGQIKQFHTRGTHMLTGLKTFATSYNKAVKTFSQGLKQCATQLEKDLLS